MKTIGFQWFWPTETAFLLVFTSKYAFFHEFLNYIDICKYRCGLGNGHATPSFSIVLICRGGHRWSSSSPKEKEMGTPLSLPLDKMDMDIHLSFSVNSYIHVLTLFLFLLSWGHTHMFRHRCGHLHLSREWTWAHLFPHHLRKQTWKHTHNFPRYKSRYV